MNATASYMKIERDELPNVLSAPDSAAYGQTDLAKELRKRFAKTEIIVGYWANIEDSILPDFIVIPDPNFDDTVAWLSAYIDNLSPLTQWMRIWKVSELSNALEVLNAPSLERSLGPWIGAILAEYALTTSNHALKDSSGAGALATSSFAAGRACAVWGHSAPFDLIQKRHDIVYGQKHLPAEALDLYSIWYVLAGERWGLRPPIEARGLASFRSIFRSATVDLHVNSSDLMRIADSLAEEFSLPELRGCATQTQKSRVDSLDNLGEKLLEGPMTVSTAAILGLGASFVDPGASVLPELLRRFNNRLPAASVWAGAFAGAWHPVRVLSEHGGLGRLVAKELLKSSGIFEKPSSDISYLELERRSGGGLNAQTGVRGLLSRTLFLELYPGIVTPLAVSRNETSRQSETALSKAKGRQQVFDLNLLSVSDVQKESAAASSNALANKINSIEERLSKMEKLMAGQNKAGARRKPR